MLNQNTHNKKERQQNKLVANFEDNVNTTNEDVANDDQARNKRWLEEEASIWISEATQEKAAKGSQSSLQL